MYICTYVHMYIYIYVYKYKSPYIPGISHTSTITDKK